MVIDNAYNKMWYRDQQLRDKNTLISPPYKNKSNSNSYKVYGPLHNIMQPSLIITVIGSHTEIPRLLSEPRDSRLNFYN